jgi:ATP phosphoribosyltransferase regulatory subunit HisZ
MNYVQVDLTDEQCAELDAADGNPDLTETVLRRFAEEAMQKVEAERPAKEVIEELADTIRFRLFTDVLLCVHYLLHAKRGEEASTILCPVAAMLEGVKPPMEVMGALLEKLDAVNLERTPAEGCA